MIEVELEKTYLVKRLPEGLAECSHQEISDIYFPVGAEHPVTRIRQKGDYYVITKKQPIHGTDSSEQEEHTIRLSEEEFRALAKLEGKRVRKIRYDYLSNGIKAEVDVFQDDLAGLVLADVEFEKVDDKNSFAMPDFCLVEVTQDATFAGGMLCGKKYSDIEEKLKELGYVRLMA